MCGYSVRGKTPIEHLGFLFGHASLKSVLRSEGALKRRSCSACSKEHEQAPCGKLSFLVPQGILASPSDSTKAATAAQASQNPSCCLCSGYKFRGHGVQRIVRRARAHRTWARDGSGCSTQAG